jgi:hypothetical protein
LTLFRKNLKKEIRNLLTSEKTQSTIEEKYQRRLREENPGTEDERKKIRQEITKEVLHVTKEDEELYKKEIEV